jgi:hypothetical protein
MAEIEAQHFVSRFYLRNFNPDPIGKEVKSIAFYDLKRKLHVSFASIAHECQKKYLYGKDLVLENAFSELEGRVASIFKEIIRKNQRPKVLTVDYFHLLSFLVFQHLKTPAYGKQINWIATMTMRMMTKGRKEFENIDTSKFKIVMDMPEVVALSTSKEQVPLLGDLCMKILLNKTDVEFITSDAPVIFFNQWCQEWPLGGNIGTTAMGLQIFFPISNRHVVVLYDQDIYVAGKGEQIVEIKDTRDVEMINALQLLGLDEKIYFSGNKKTKDSIDRLPFEHYRTPEKALHANTSIGVDPEPETMSELVHLTSSPTKFRLDLSVMNVKNSKKNILLDDRVRKERKVVREFDVLNRGPRHLRYPTRTKGATIFRGFEPFK